VVAGIDTNIALFQELMIQPDILDGNYDIHWLERWMKSQAELAAAS
jgi:acetyl-CoA carboxylase biotin carboxylase subunit